MIQKLDTQSIENFNLNKYLSTATTVKKNIQHNSGVSLSKRRNEFAKNNVKYKTYTTTFR